ncbi:glutamate receptor 2.7-like [Impatiens glandulifera]|uniref:glutamate receptor 2.7-like n=1 Tax=Impatiens glandulifera TaxID=253017 RepID=UPI001FB0567E|nr:glutamate receptor 2.7-like [Impatiens glandulifera]
MEIAATQQFNNSISLRFIIAGNPLQAAQVAAKAIIEDKKVDVIIGMETWEETALVAEVGNQARIPVISFASSSIGSILSPIQWPFLVRMSTNASSEAQCIASIIHSFQWRRIIVIYELDRYGNDGGALAALSYHLGRVNSNIIDYLILPTFSSLSNPGEFIRREFAKLLVNQTPPRIFVTLRLSLQMAAQLFHEAKLVGLMNFDSAWLLSSSVSDLLESADASLISNMEGALGVKNYYPENTFELKRFKREFKKAFRITYPDEDISEPGIHALRAYDSINLVGNATINRNDTNGKLIDKILSSNFTGLSGTIHFHKGELSARPVFSIVNVVGKRYKELGFWSSNSGFSDRPFDNLGSNSMEIWSDLVSWPQNLTIAAGLINCTKATVPNPIKIGIPTKTVFDKYVKVNMSNKESQPTGFCIDVFQNALQILEKKHVPFPPHVFCPYEGTYDKLVDQVANNVFDVVVGDVTILSDRLQKVDFSLPFAESYLTLLAPVTPRTDDQWLFFKTFSNELWLSTCFIFFYNVVIVWILEHRDNPEFEGPWYKQLGTALWFTYCSIYYVHGSKTHKSYTKIVLAVWFFVVMALTATFTSILSAAITVDKLRPEVTDVEWLREHNSTVGCDEGSFMTDYLVNVMKLQNENIKNISYELDYRSAFENRNITGAFLELPYAKAFLSEYCGGYKTTELPDRFGGFGFAFQKGSWMTSHFSEAILNMAEKGELKKMEDKWFPPSKECSSMLDSNNKAGRLSWISFQGLYLISIVTSSACCLIFTIRRLLLHCREACGGNLGLGLREKTRDYWNRFWSRLVSFLPPSVKRTFRGFRKEHKNSFDTSTNDQV